MTSKAICPICNKRRAERYCPAKGEKICAIDCGTEREVTIDCPIDCPYLIAAHRWEQEHPKPVAEEDLPFSDVSISPDLIRLREVALAGLGYTVLLFESKHRSLVDADVFAAVQALAETRRTLLSGIYYEKPPQYPLAGDLYASLGEFFEKEKQHAAERPGIPPLKDAEIFQLLVFFLRFGLFRSNGRPRTRGFLAFLHSTIPAGSGPVPAKEESRIVIP